MKQTWREKLMAAAAEYDWYHDPPLNVVVFMCDHKEIKTPGQLIKAITKASIDKKNMN
jgi:hypothetical protein